MSELKAAQIIVAPFQKVGGPLSYSIIALGVDGRVYRYDPKCEGWLPWSMKVATCIDDHKGHR